MNIFDLIKNLIKSELKENCNQIAIDSLVNKISENNFSQDYLLLNNSEYNVIPKDKLLYIEYDASKKKYSLQSEDKIYQIDKDKVDITLFLSNNLIQVDKRIIVNIDKVKKCNSYTGVVFFDENIEKAINVRVSLDGVKEVISRIGKENDLLHNQMESVYSPINKRNRIYE